MVLGVSPTFRWDLGETQVALSFLRESEARMLIRERPSNSGDTHAASSQLLQIFFVSRISVTIMEQRHPIPRPRFRHFATMSEWLRFRRFRFLEKMVRKQILKEIRPVQFAHPESPGKLFLRPGTADFGIFWEIFIDRFYNALLRYPPGNLASEVRLIVDLGGNCGLFTRFAILHYPQAHIVTVEPDTANLDVCRMNVQASGNGDAVKLIRACAAAKNGQASLYRIGRLTSGYSMVDASEGAESIDTLTVPEILMRAGFDSEIDSMKCDIEGAEREVFANCREWIGRVRCLTIELHPPYNVEAFVRDLIDNGARLRIVDRRDGDLSSMLTLCRD